MERAALEQLSKPELIEIIVRIEQQVAALEVRCARVGKRNAELTTRCAKLEKQNAELAARCVRLEGELAKARKNSSKPPSSDIEKPARPNPPNGKPRHIGGQAGHSMHARPVLTPDAV